MPETTEGTSAAAAAATATDAAAATQAAVDATKAADAATAAAGNATAAATAAPEKYDLKLPDGSTFDAALVTRTADTARVLGLTNEAAQKLLDAQIAELTTTSATVAEKAAADARAAQLEAMKPGGTVWTEREAAWRAEALADAEVGGSPEKLQANVDLAKRVVTKFATPGAVEFFDATGLGSHPELLRMFAKIGRAMSEGSLVLGGAQSDAPTTEEARLAKRYPTMVAKSS